MNETKPSAGAPLAARAILHPMAEPPDTESELAEMIDEKTGLPELVAALEKAEHGFHLLAHNLALHVPGSPLITWAKNGEADAKQALAKHHPE